MQYARNISKELAVAAARDQGAVGELTTTCTVTSKKSDDTPKAILLYELIKSTATGKAF